MDTGHVWKSFYDPLRSFVLGQVGDRDAVDDILQEIFLRIHGNLHTVKVSDKLEPWLYRVARNAIADHYRGRKKLNAQTELTESIMAPGNNVTEVAEDLSFLRPMVDELPDKYREALILTEFDGLSQVEVAHRLGMSVSGVKSRVQRAREKLKETMLACCHFEFDRFGQMLSSRRREPDCRYCNDDASCD